MSADTAQMAAAAAPARRRPSPWRWLVAGSAALIGALAVGVLVSWAATSHTRVAAFDVRGALRGIDVDLGTGDVEVVGGGQDASVGVRRTDRYSYGHRAAVHRSVRSGVLALRSRCPDTVLGTCSSGYRLAVPDNVAVTIRTRGGHVRFTDFRGAARITTDSGSVDVSGYCGFSLSARSVSGDLRASTVCAPEHLVMRSRSGDVTALVPPGRYRLDARTHTGRRVVSGVAHTPDATFQVQALSTSGDVHVVQTR